MKNVYDLYLKHFIYMRKAKLCFTFERATKVSQCQDGLKEGLRRRAEVSLVSFIQEKAAG